MSRTPRGRKCRRKGCTAWATPSGLCAFHDPQVRARAATARRERARKNALPELRSLEDAETWINFCGQALASGKMSPDVAREIRLAAEAFAKIRQERPIQSRFESLERRNDSGWREPEISRADREKIRWLIGQLADRIEEEFRKSHETDGQHCPEEVVCTHPLQLTK